MPKLGQVLVRQGWVSRTAVDRALSAQTATGWRLGTCLLDSRVLSEDLLLQALSQQYRVPGAGVEDLREIPDEVIETLPARLAEKLEAVPFRAYGTQVHVAMMDPDDLTAQDELAFVLGKRVRPYVAHEVRILEALERYYDVPFPGRLASLVRRLDRQRYVTADESEGATAPPTSSAGARTRRLWEQPEAALFSEEHTRPARTTDTPPPAAAGGPEPAGEPVPDRAPEQTTPPEARRRPKPRRPSSIELSEDEREALAMLEADAARAPTAAEPEPEPAEPEPGGDDTRPIPAGAPPMPPSLSQAEERLHHCRDAEEVGDVLLAVLGPMFERVALFKVLRDRIEGWKGTGTSLDTACLESYSTELSQPSVFLNLRLSGSFHLGSLGPMAAHRSLARCWGGGLPKECLLLPVRVRGRLVTVIYLDRAPEPLGKLDLDALLHLAVVTEETYERAILRKKRD